MADHDVRQARIVEALEAEKMKIGKDLEEMQRKLALRENRTPKHGNPPRLNGRIAVVAFTAFHLFVVLQAHI